MWPSIVGWIQTYNNIKDLSNKMKPNNSAVETSAVKTPVNPNRITDPLLDPSLQINSSKAFSTEDFKKKDVLEPLLSAIGDSASSSVHSGSQLSEVPEVANFDGAPISSAVMQIQNPELRANAFYEMMANSAHQREVQDLIKAGLNPVLSAKYGGASSGAWTSSESGSSGSFGSGKGDSENSIFGVKLETYKSPKNASQMLYNTAVKNADLVEGLVKAVFK